MTCVAGLLLMRRIGGRLSWMFATLGSILILLSRGWSATLATGVRLVIARLVLIFALLLNFHGRLRVVRSMFIPGALHGIEASFLAEAGLRKLRAAFVRVVCPVVSLLPILVRCLVCWMVRLSVILRFALCGFGSVCSVGSLLTGRVKFPKFIDSWGMLMMGALVMVLLSCLQKVLPRLGLFGLLIWLVGCGERLAGFEHFGWSHPTFRSAVLEGSRSKVSANLCARKGFRADPWLDVDGTLQLLNSHHVRER